MAKKPGKLFTAPRVLPKLLENLIQEVCDAFLSVEGAFAELFTKVDEPSRTLGRSTTGATVVSRVGDIVQIVPPATGATVLLPGATTDTLGKVVVVMVEGLLGAVLVKPAPGSEVQGAASLTLSGVGVRTFRSDGAGGWWLDRNLISSSDIIPADFDWESTLSRGNSAGAFSPFVPAGQRIGFGVEGSLPAGGQLASSTDLLVRTVGDFRVQVDSGIGFFVGVAAINVTTGNWEAETTGDILFQAASGIGLFANVARTNVGVSNIDLNALLDIIFTTAGVERFRIENTGAWDLAGDEGALGEVLTSQGAGTPPIWAAGGAGSTPDIVSSDHILTADFTLAADEGAIIPRYHQINAGVTLTLAAGSTFAIY